MVGKKVVYDLRVFRPFALDVSLFDGDSYIEMKRIYGEHDLINLLHRTLVDVSKRIHIRNGYK